MDRNKATTISREVEDILQKKYPKMEISVKGGSFRDNFLRFTIEFAEKVNGTVMTKEMDDLLFFANINGIRIEEFDYPSLGRVRLLGYKPRATKYPYIIQQISTGKKYKADTRSIVEAQKGS